MEQGRKWKGGVARSVITPQKPIWLAGYANREHPAEGKLHDLWAKALALEDAKGSRSVLLTSDLCGIPKWMFESVCEKMKRKHGLQRSQIRLTYSHNHCAPVVRGELECYYPLDETQRRLIDEYSRWLEETILATMEKALSAMKPAKLFAGEGICTFAVNRRNNRESEVLQILAHGEKPKGPVEHSVPVLAVQDENGELMAIVFAYACHNTTLNFYQWCGDYAGFAQMELEATYPQAVAMFVAGCGGDQNPIPRRSVELCQKYGRMLANVVKEVLKRPMRPLTPEFKGAFAFVNLDYEQVMTIADLEQALRSETPHRRRWAKQMLRMLDEGKQFDSSYPYAVQVWRLGDQIWIALGGEALVDYALRFRREFGERVWVTSYAHDLTGYIPSRRNLEEGGYEVNCLWEYGHPAERWAFDVEERIAETVAKLVKDVSG